MTILTPTFADQLKVNGAAGAPFHILPAHEPTREDECPASLPVGTAIEAPHEPTSMAVAGLKVALIGTAPSSRALAPYADSSWQIWGCSPGNMNALPRVDVWFELHSNLLWPEYENYGKPYIEWLKVQKFPVYMQDQSLVERATPFPMFELVKEFGRDFFTSSFAWMMALAMKAGATEIALYGIDMASRDEYILQRPGFYYFRYLAEKRGIKVSAPHESDIMQSPALYAYADSTPMGRKIFARETEVKGRIAQFDQQVGQGTQNKTYLQGALEDIDYFKSIWGGAMDEIVLLKAEKAEFATRNFELEREVAQLRQIAAQPAPVAAAVKRKRKRT